jgi:hypothetical protein
MLWIVFFLRGDKEMITLKRIAWVVLAISGLHLVAMYLGFSTSQNGWYIAYSLLWIPIIALAIIVLIRIRQSVTKE